MLNVHWRHIVSAIGLSLIMLAIVGCGQSSQPLPDIDATVEARVDLSKASDPVATYTPTHMHLTEYLL